MSARPRSITRQLFALSAPVIGSVFGFVLDLGAWGVWLSFPVAIVAKCVFGMIAYRRGTWAVTGLTPRHQPATMPEA